MSLNFDNAKYTSPSGKEFEFAYENLSKETDLKTATFTFPEKDGAYIQGLGRGGRRFPFSCIFSGSDCYKKADAFEEALEERGVGHLVHPLYGDRKVVPTGTIKRDDGVITDVNTVTVEIVFSETIVDEDVLQSVTALSSEIEAQADIVVEAGIKEFLSVIDVANTSDAIGLSVTLASQQKTISDTVANILNDNSRNSVESMKDKISAAYKTVQKTTKEASKKIDEVRSYANGIFKLMRLPAQVVSSGLQVASSFGDMVTDIVRTFTKDPIGLNKIKNNFAATKMSLQGALLSVCEALTFSCGKPANEGGFKSREEAVSAAEAIQDMADTINNYCDSKNNKDLFVENEASYLALLEVEKKSIALILNTAFSLKNRRIIKLDRDRQLIELVHELYGDIDSNLDEFIVDNKLNFNSIAIIPMGTEISYYV